MVASGARGEFLLPLLKTLDESFIADLEQLHQSGVFLDMTIDQSKRVMTEYRMSISEVPLIDRFGEVVNAITDRDSKEIIFNGPSLSRPNTTLDQTIQILLHEICRRYSEAYFRLEDTYQKSVPLYQAIISLGAKSIMFNASSNILETSRMNRFFK